MNFLEKICLTLANANTTDNRINILRIYDLAQGNVENWNKTIVSNDTFLTGQNRYLKNISVLCEYFEEKNINNNMDSFPINKIKYNLIKFVYPFVVFFGVISNLLSIFLLLKIKSTKSKANRNFSSCLIMLASSDVILILFGSLRE